MQIGCSLPTSTYGMGCRYHCQQVPSVGWGASAAWSVLRNTWPLFWHGNYCSSKSELLQIAFSFLSKPSSKQKMNALIVITRQQMHKLVLFISVHSCGLRKLLGNLRTNTTVVRVFLWFNLMALRHLQVTLMLSTDINITETTYSCQFQYVFGNQ